MKRARVARRYAKALFDAALESKALELVEKDLEGVGQTLAASEELRALVASPVVSNARKKAAVGALFEKKVQPLTFGFLRLLVEKNREGSLGDVLEEFRDLLDAHRGIARGELSSVVALSAEQRKVISDQLSRVTGKKVVLAEKIDPALLGGFMVRIGDMVYDASLHNQLKKLRQNLIES